MSRNRKREDSLGTNDTSVGADYTPEEVEFIKAMDLYCLRTGRRFPTTTEVLKVAKSLGYKKVATSTGLPVYEG